MRNHQYFRLFRTNNGTIFTSNRGCKTNRAALLTFWAIARALCAHTIYLQIGRERTNSPNAKLAEITKNDVEFRCLSSRTLGGDVISPYGSLERGYRLQRCPRSSFRTPQFLTSPLKHSVV
jgi:hypothetical protein